MIYKTLSRLLLCNALSYKHDNKHVTIAEDRVFDTAIDDIQKYNNAPIILINTNSSQLDLNNKNASSFSTYLYDKISIELLIFGGWSELGDYVNNDRYLMMLLNLFEQQTIDALFKLQNIHAEKAREFIEFGSIQSQTIESDATENKVFAQKIEIDIRFNEMYNSDVNSQDVTSMIDLYDKYLSIYPVDMVNKLKDILAINDATRLDKLNTEIQTNNAPELTITNEWTHD